jgi:oligopeptide/dipeptide ABC transporter ATP-binding protein
MTGGLTVERLRVRYPTSGGQVLALDDVTFEAKAGAILGIVGESGSGKSTLVNAICGALAAPTAEVSGDVSFGGKAVLTMRSAELRGFRETDLGYIGQDPHASLDPTMRVGRQLRHALARSRGESAASEDYQLHFGRVGLPDPLAVARCYPHQLSGGMAQRVVIAIALARSPKLIIADEPTASLDNTLRSHILRLITQLAQASGATLLMVSHDLEAISQYCDSTAVMYGGRVVELAQTQALFESPLHPYTDALLSVALGRETPGTWLAEIPGAQQVRYDNAPGCVFASRCAFSVAACLDQTPAPQRLSGREVSCHRAAELTLGRRPQSA